MLGVYERPCWLRWGLQTHQRRPALETLPAQEGTTPEAYTEQDTKAEPQGQQYKTSLSERGGERAEESRKVSYTEKMRLEMGLKYNI